MPADLLSVTNSVTGGWPRFPLHSDRNYARNEDELTGRECRKSVEKMYIGRRGDVGVFSLILNDALRCCFCFPVFRRSTLLQNHERERSEISA